MPSKQPYQNIFLRPPPHTAHPEAVEAFHNQLKAMGISNECFDDITQTVDGNFKDSEGETREGNESDREDAPDSDDNLESDLESDHEDAPNSNDGNLENSIQNN
mmetsp:Transcript_29461/g.43258  ORF Transcript_29461/g.43258 Transcript_29461/m.43258 type:complete len:104 (-) Transcript_29461:136-447(-)